MANQGREGETPSEALLRCTSELDKAVEDLRRESEANRMAREQFRDLYSELAAVLETSLVGVVMTQHREITRINKMAAQLLGYGMDELVGRDLPALLDEGDGDLPDLCYERILTGECVEGRECVFERSGGGAVAVRVSARLIDPKDAGRGVVWVFADISREVEARRLREDVDRITRHDLKSPLQGILGAPELLIMEGGLSESQLKLLRMIEHSAADMLDMINLSLDLYKMETGRYELRPEAVDLAPVVRKVVEELGPLARAKDLGVRVLVKGREEPSWSASVVGEELLCRSMFSNLIKNALEAAPCHSAVTLAVTRIRGEYAIDIHNLGGVHEDVRERFFEKYATAGKRRGTGLGTYSAKLIAQTLGGSIVLDSREDETAVRVILPAARN